MNDKKIFGVGLSRTGTTSLHVALLMLGISSNHYPQQKSLNWLVGNFKKELLDDYEAYLDVPVAAYYRDLDIIYPEAQFILTLRNEDEWLESVRKHFQNSRKPSKETGLRDMLRVAVYGCVNFNADRFLRIFREHNQAVKDYFSKRQDDLLVMDITKGDGWDTLCHFLKTERPGYEFPNMKLPFLYDFKEVKSADLTSLVGDPATLVDRIIAKHNNKSQ